MTEEDPKSWYIDAWCPMDGLAFASRRHVDPLVAAETIYLCPPFFEPEQIGSLATALAATRGHFQSGFFDLEGEIEFPSLAHVIETVKRVYLAGGAKNDPTGILPLPVSPVLPDAVAVESLLSSKMQDEWPHLLNAITGEQSAMPSSIAGPVAEFVKQSIDSRLLMKFASISLAPILKAFVQNCDAEEADKETMLRWVTVLCRMGFRIDIDKSGNNATLNISFNDCGFEDEIPELANLQKEKWLTLQRALKPAFYRQSQMSSNEIVDVLTRVPLPVNWPRPSGGDVDDYIAYVPSLGALFYVAVANRLFLRRLTSPLDFVPIVFADLAVNTAWAARSRYSDDITELHNSTSKWIARCFPILNLDSRIERQIDNFSVYEMQELSVPKNSIGVAQQKPIAMDMS